MTLMLRSSARVWKRLYSASKIPTPAHQQQLKPRLLSIEELEKLHGKERLWFTATTESLFKQSGPGMSVPLAFAAGLVTVAGLYWVSAPPDSFHPTAKDPRKHLPVDGKSLRSSSTKTAADIQLEPIEQSAATAVHHAAQDATGKLSAVNVIQL
jgi:hypothetical protein